jgi:hypothetical protein
MTPRTYIGAGPTLGPGRKGIISPMNSPNEVKKHTRNKSRTNIPKIELSKINEIQIKSHPEYKNS